MNTLQSLIRIVILLAIFSLGLFMLCGQEADETQAAWLVHFVVDKLLAACAFYYYNRLYHRWCIIDPWLIAYDKKIRITTSRQIYSSRG